MSIASVGSRCSQIGEEDVTRAVEGALRWAEGQPGDNGSLGFTDFVNALSLLYTPIREEVAFSAGKDGKPPLSPPLPCQRDIYNVLLFTFPYGT
jgi:hypothetical protein